MSDFGVLVCDTVCVMFDIFHCVINYFLTFTHNEERKV